MKKTKHNSRALRIDKDTPKDTRVITVNRLTGAYRISGYTWASLAKQNALVFSDSQQYCFTTKAKTAAGLKRAMEAQRINI